MKSFFAIISLLVSTNLLALNPFGKFYMFSSDIFKIKEVKIDSLSVTITDLDWNYSALHSSREMKIISKNEVGNRVNILLFDSINQVYEPMILQDIGKNSFRTPFLSEKFKFKSAVEANKFILEDTMERYSLICLSIEEVTKIKTYRDLSNISEIDLKKLNELLCSTKMDYQNNFRNMDLNLMFYFLYMPSKTREILIDLGYNAIVPDKELGQIGNKV